MARYRRKIDDNQTLISQELYRLGIRLMDSHTLGGGFPDGVAGVGGLNFLVEVKSTSSRKLTPAEQDWHRNHGGRILIVSTTEELLRRMMDSVQELMIELPNIHAELAQALDDYHSGKECSIDDLIIPQGKATTRKAVRRALEDEPSDP